MSAAQTPGSPMSIEQATAFASNPNALIEPSARASLSPETLAVLQSAMAGAIHPVFWVGAVVCALALFVAVLLPRRRGAHRAEGERMIMAEQTTINARNQPIAEAEG